MESRDVFFVNIDDLKKNLFCLKIFVVVAGTNTAAVAAAAAVLCCAVLFGLFTVVTSVQQIKSNLAN